MKKFKLNAVAAIAASVAASGAFAQVNIDAATPAPVTVANEIIATAAAPVTLTNLANALNIQSAVGYALSNGEVRYVRVELANGVFTTASATSPNANTSIGAINGVGTSVIYFSITAGAGGIPANEVLTIAGNRDITGTASNMTVSYSVYDQPSQAQAGGTTGRIVNKDAKPYINFAKSHRVVVTTDSAIADVEASPAFTAFKSGQTPSLTATARLASLDYKLAVAPQAPTAIIKADGTPVTLTNLMATGATGTKLVVTGDFTAAANTNGTYTGTALARVYLSTGTNCTTVAAVNATEVTSTTATFNVGDTATTANPNLCFTPRATVAIPASTYTASLNAVSATPATYALASTASGQVSEITRNGTELQAPLFQTTPGYVSRFVLTNTGSADAPFTVSVRAEDGNTVTLGTVAGGTIKAGKQLVIPAADLAAAFTGSPRGFAVFTVARPNATIQGAYQIVNQTSGAVSNSNMVRPGTN